PPFGKPVLSEVEGLRANIAAARAAPVEARSSLSLLVNLPHPLLYHVRRAEGNEPTSREDKDSQIIQHPEKGEKKIRQQVERIQDVKDCGSQNRLGPQGDPPVSK